MTPHDDLPRIELAGRLAGELFALLADVAAGPAGRHLRRAADADGKPLFVCCEVGDRVVWAPLAMVDLIRGLRAAAPAGDCPRCGGGGCQGCDHAGYLPAAPDQLLKAARPHTLPVGGHVADVWGWVRASKRGA